MSTGAIKSFTNTDTRAKSESHINILAIRTKFLEFDSTGCSSFVATATDSSLIDRFDWFF
jgi:hypothetical protein